MATMSQKTELPLRVEDWTREQVYYWVTEVIKADKKYADKLYESLFMENFFIILLHMHFCTLSERIMKLLSAVNQSMPHVL